MVWALTCSDFYAARYINKTKEQAGAGAKLATSEKQSKYSNLKSIGVDLVVVAGDTSGVWCDEGQRWIYEIRNHYFEKSGEP